MKWTARKRPQSVLGLSLADGQLHAAHVARAKGALGTLRTGHATLALDLLHPEPELVGQEIRNHLEAAGLRERHCVVALPPEWILSQHTTVPELSPEDTASLLQIEAEKGFPCTLDELQVARSPQRVGSAQYVTQLAVRHEHLARLAEVLHRAGLKAVSFTVGVAALPVPAGSEAAGRATFVLGPRGATLLVTAGGGVCALRTVEAAVDSEAGERVINGRALARELRITVEQIPSDLRREIRHLVLRGDERTTTQVAGFLAEWARGENLALEVAPAAAGEMAQRVAEQFLRAGGSALEFLPPRPSRWAVLAARYSSRRLGAAGLAAAAVALVTVGAFGWQEYRLWSLRSQWSQLAAPVADLEATQARIREFRPWYDTSVRNLAIMRRVVECFPDNGSVTAKSFEIHAPGTVSVAGTARDNASLLRTLDQLRQAKEIKGLTVEQIRGKTPAQFTFTFRWVGNSGT